MASRISLKYFEHKNIIFCAQSRQANLVQSWSVCLVLAINETSLTIYIDYTLEQKKSSEYREQNSFHPKLTSRDKCKIRMYIFTSLCENTGKIGEMLFLHLPLVLPGRSASSPSPLNSRGTTILTRGGGNVGCLFEGALSQQFLCVLVKTAQMFDKIPIL